MARGERFDAAYYRRFYGDAHTRVVSAADVRRLATFVHGYLAWLGQPVRTILDLGCGLGHWQKAAAALWPRARYHGVEYSRHLCDRLGWTHGSAVDFAADDPFDLVICQGVLQYLDDRDAARAVKNLGRLCGGALYLEALTTRDWRENVDRKRTDGDVHLRSGDWYRRRLRTAFRDCGGGLFAARAAALPMFELEARH